jgi:hypothetical protein
MKKELRGDRRAARGVLIAVVFSSMVLVAAPDPRGHVLLWSCPKTVNTNLVSFTPKAVGEEPEFVAVSVGQGVPDFQKEVERAMESFRAEVKTNRTAKLVLPDAAPKAPLNPKWVPFQTNLVVDLGPGEGERWVLFSYKYKGEAAGGDWRGTRVTIQRATPTLCIVNPTNFLCSQPTIQLQGLTSTAFQKLRFDQFDGAGQKIRGDGQGLGVSIPGCYDFKGHENYFTFSYVDLSPGTNTFVFRGTDVFGNEMSTNLVIVFSTAQDHTPPRIEVAYPKPNAEVSGETETVHGQMDDFTAKLEARIQTKDGSTTREALVEGNGHFWIRGIPVVLGSIQITLTATDAAGNRSETNFTVIGVEEPIITMDPVKPPNLWRMFTAATGRVSPANYDVWVNGVQAKVAPDGTWSAERVPVIPPAGGTVTFEMTALPKGGAPGNKAKAAEVVSAQGTLGTNAVVLNSSAPACGVFRLHLSGTGGRSFVVFTSTNLADWTPILTNIDVAPSFDRVLGSKSDACRFFKIVPVP